MNKRNLIHTYIIAIFLVAAILGSPEPSPASTANHEIWADLLGKYVKPGGVDYSGFKAEEDRWEDKNA
jgi:hypothetical protein